MNEKMTQTEWNALRYPIELQQLSKEEGDGWMAWIPALGRGLFMVDANTPAEAIEELEQLRKSLYDTVIRSGQPVPLPSDITDEPQASGKWLQRASRRLHAELRAAAEKDGVSFNTYCESAMLRGHMMLSAADAMDNLASGICEDFQFSVAREARIARYTFSGLEVESQRRADDMSDYQQFEIGEFDGAKAA